jgi:glycosyltransferase involved in cell wall biosynthesis
MRRPTVLLLGHYPLDRLDRAPKVRTFRMAEALARVASLRLITGTRSERAPWLETFIRAGGLRDVDGVYLESATSTMTPWDWQFLRRVRRAGLPLAIFIRDWYQRFPDLYPPRHARDRALAAAYALTLSAYRRLATTLFFPSVGLMDLMPHPDRRLLPPAGTVLEPPGWPRRPGQVVYVGANGPHDGVDTAISAMGRVAESLPDVRLVLVMRRAEWPRSVPACCTLVEAEGDALAPWLWTSALALIPRRDTAYNRLALPVKLFDYWAHGLPVLTTEGSEAAKLVVTGGMGWAVADTPAAYADALRRLLTSPGLLREMGHRALQAVRTEHNWDRRAEDVLTALADHRRH